MWERKWKGKSGDDAHVEDGAYSQAIFNLLCQI